MQHAAVADTLGGLRRTHLSISKLPSGWTAGIRMRLALLKVVSADKSIIHRCLDALRSGGSGPTSMQLDACRMSLLGVGPSDPALAPSERCELFPSVLHHWVRLAGDPDFHVPEWLSIGAPMGLRLKVPHCGVFPLHSDPSPLNDPDDLAAED
eukprot:1934391-Amphidinium_carterae.1